RHGQSTGATARIRSPSAALESDPLDLPRRGVRPPMAPHAHGLGLCPMRERCSTVAGVAVTRLRVDELMYAWFADRDTPMQIGLLGLFDAQPFQHPHGQIGGA